MPNNENATSQGGTSYSATVNGSGAIAQGHGAQALGAGAVHVGGNNSGNINTGTQTNGISAEQLALLFSPLLTEIKLAPAEKQAAAVQHVEALKAEVAKGDKAEDKVMAKMIEGFVALVPAAVGVVVSMFASPILGGIAKPATEYVLEKLKETLG
ncbi:MAG: hypothetical protein PHI11_09455 [Gallionella sp.]|nr:hypothetical protein [Gallionella sp.]